MLCLRSLENSISRPPLSTLVFISICKAKKKMGDEDVRELDGDGDVFRCFSSHYGLKKSIAEIYDIGILLIISRVLEPEQE